MIGRMSAQPEKWGQTPFFAAVCTARRPGKWGLTPFFALWVGLLAGCQTYGPLVDPCTHDKDDLAHTTAINSSDSLNILVLSGGGRNGAYGAGFLRGLASRDDIDMQFDIVTGVSTGAFQGALAFLGRSAGPDSDYARLSALYTHVENRDIYRLRVLPFRTSVYHTKPLARLLDEKITDADIAAIGRVTHRLFYVGTLDLAQGIVKVHDMGCVARTHPPSYFRKILLASASIPALFPSVQIKNSLQVDGGIRDQALLEPFMLPPGTSPKLTVIVNMPLAIYEIEAKKSLISTGVRTVFIMMNEGLRNDVAAIRAAQPGRTYVKHIPSDAMEVWDPIRFDTDTMRALEALGYEHATQSPIPWD